MGASGVSRDYALYLPKDTACDKRKPHPLVVLLHGFLMTEKQHANNSLNLAQHGFVVYAPDMSKILLGEQTRSDNVADVLDGIEWLTKQSTDPKSPLYKMIDRNRVGIAGNSAGGAVCFEVALEAQKAHVPLAALCSLDGVPWDRTKSRIADLHKLKILSLRAEPSLCNFHGKVLEYLSLLKFPCDDIKVNGAHHCDAENPSTFGCRCVCGASNDSHRRIFEKLVLLFFEDSLMPARDARSNQTFQEAVDELAQSSKVVAHLNERQPTEVAHGNLEATESAESL